MLRLWEAWPAPWKALWLAVLVGYAAMAYAGSADFTRGAGMVGATLASGCGLLWAVQATGHPWLHQAWPVFVALAALMPGVRPLLAASLAVPALEAPHLLASVGSPGMAGEAAVTLSSVAVGFIVHGARSAALRRARGGASPAEAGGAPASMPGDLGGLERQGNAELRELLRTAAFATGAEGVSLFLLKGDRLILHTTSARGSGYTDALISPVPRWYAGDVIRLRHSIMTGSLGSEAWRRPEAEDGPDTEGEATSIAAAPVMDGAVMLGVLAMNSSRQRAFSSHAVYVTELFAAQVARALARERIMAEVEDGMERLRTAHEQGLRLASTLEPDQMVAALAEIIEETVPLDVHFLIRKHGRFLLAYSSGAPEFAGQTYSLDGTLAGMAVDEQEHKYFDDLKGYSMDVLPVRGLVMRSALVLPLVSGDEALGALVLTSPGARALSAREIDFLRVIGAQAAVSLKNSLLYAELRRRAQGAQAPAPEVSGRERILTMLEKAAEIPRMGPPTPIALLVVGVDDLDGIAEAFGADAAGLIMRSLGAVVKAEMPPGGIWANLGHADMGAILPGHGFGEAKARAETLRARIAAEPFISQGTEVRVSASIGIAVAPPGRRTGALALMGRALAARHQAGLLGGNRVEIALDA
jgi:GAF domain-containing protein